MTVSLVRQVGQESTACRARLSEVLQRIEEERSVSQEELLLMLAQSTCSVGHRLILAAVTGGLTWGDSAGQIRLTEAGDEWLLEAARPAPDWAAEGRQGAHPLRDWQVEALDAWADHGRHGVIEAVTGTGKSRVGIEAIREALERDFNVVVAVPTKDLVDQWVKGLRQNGIGAVGRFGDGFRDTFLSHDIIVSTVQSLYLDPPIRPDGKVLLVADECHRYGSEKWRRALHHSYRRRLGLTATFERNDDGIQELTSYFGGSPVFTIGFDRAIRDGVVAHYDVKLLGVDLTDAERSAYRSADKTVRDARVALLAAGFTESPFGVFMHEVGKAASGEDPDPTVEDMARRYLKAFSERIDVMTNAAAKLSVGTALVPWVRRSQGSILFTRRIETAQDLAALLRDGGVRAEAIHSDLAHGDRKDLLVRLRAGALKSLVAPAVLDEGIDVPEVDLGVVMGGSKSRRQMIQRMGRVLRLKGDGRKATFILVYARNTAEDLSISDGEEGCLDLIVETADNVEELEVIDDAIVPVLGSEPHRTVRAQQVTDFEHPDGPVRIAKAARAAYMRAHGATAAEAARALRRMLNDFTGVAKIVARPDGLPGRSLAHLGFQLLATDEEVLHYASHRDDANTWDDLSDSASGLEAGGTDYSQSGDEAAVGGRSPGEPADATLAIRLRGTFYDRIDPSTVAMSMDCVTAATEAFGFGDPYSWEALASVRDILAEDLEDCPDVVQGPLGWTLHGDNGEWVISHGADRVISVRPSTGRQDTLEAAARDAEDADPPSAAAGQAECLVSQLERLAALHAGGALTTAEFHLAKSKLLGWS